MRVLVTKLQKVERVAFAPEGTHLFASGLHSGSLGYGEHDTGIDVFDLAGGAESVKHLLAGREVPWFVPLPDDQLAVAHSNYPNEAAPDYGVSLIDRRTDRDDRLVANGWSVGRWCGVSSDGRRLCANLSGNDRAQNSRHDWVVESGLGGWSRSNSDAPRLDWHINLGHDREVLALSVAPDGRSFWSAERVVSATPPYARRELVPRDADTGQSTGSSVAYPNQHITALALGERFAVAHHGPLLFVYDFAKLDKKPKKVSNPAKRKFFAGFAIHPSGKWLATAGLDGAVTLWDARTWKAAQSWTWEAGQARSICFSADGTLAAAGTNTGKIVVWDLDL
jgi:WD40 repeat protein